MAAAGGKHVVVYREVHTTRANLDAWVAARGEPQVVGNPFGPVGEKTTADSAVTACVYKSSKPYSISTPPGSTPAADAILAFVANDATDIYAYARADRLAADLDTLRPA